MPAPIMAIAKFISGRAGQQKVHGFLRKLYKGRSGIGEKLQKSGMKATWVTGKEGTKRQMLVPKKDLFSKSKVIAGKGYLGAKKKLKPVGLHIKKHRKPYGWAATGAVSWDILDRDD